MAIARYRAFHVAAARAIGRNLRGDAHEFPEDVVKLMGYFRPAEGDIPTGADQTRVHTESFVMTATVSLSRIKDLPEFP